MIFTIYNYTCYIYIYIILYIYIYKILQIHEGGRSEQITGRYTAVVISTAACDWCKTRMSVQHAVQGQLESWGNVGQEIIAVSSLMSRAGTLRQSQRAGSADLK